MDYNGLYAFNCERNDKYPIINLSKSVSIIQGSLEKASVFRKSPYLGCYVLEDKKKILWDTLEDHCLTGLQAPDTNLIIQGCGGHGSLELRAGVEYEKFHVTDIPSYKYISCNICCNEESPFYAERKLDFWWKPGTEKEFPYPDKLS